jgi:hypothetical protein
MDDAYEEYFLFPFFIYSLSHITEQERTTMKLTIIAPEMVYEHEVDPSMQVQDIIALVEAEVRAPNTLRADQARKSIVSVYSSTDWDAIR